ncbi:discoidin domain-containing protein [Sinomicrobium kalidii]|uniref:discoidin domain-containing protein n=1 Tax=Sinomicrobium kalidii TaxID=2900738 RepID=UPI001E39128C|nr:discoidin domain-containing protein [Sinomicrobium kalidii]UGU15385.1 discoidin domain-containing protein [Sinomicrobium kalidii]
MIYKELRFFCSLFFLIFSISSCNNKSDGFPDRLKEIFKSAGENKNEVEKVLQYYSPKDNSLKYKAALFLIENMPGHYSLEFEPREKWRELLKKSDSLIKIKHENYENTIKEEFYNILYGVNVKPRYETKNDIQHFKAVELIEYIDEAFKVWNKPWNKFLDFNDFCNYVLPYRMKNEPMEMGIRQILSRENNNRVNKNTTIREIAKLAQDIGTLPSNFKFIKLLKSEQGIEDIRKGRMVDCLDYANYAGMTCRAIGIPTAIDFTIWPNGRGAHYWNAVLFNKDSLLYADLNFFWGEPGSYRLRRKIAKIYRYVYANQRTELSRQNSPNKMTDFLHSPHVIDVTAQYIKTSDIDIPITRGIGTNSQWVYLCIFNDGEWRPIAVAEKVDDIVHFADIGRENIYMIAAFNGYERIPISKTFSVDKEGTVNFYQPGNIKENVILNRKAKLTERVKEFAAQMNGGVFQLSNDRNFKKVKEVYSIGKKDTVVVPMEVEINDDKLYRYARYTIPNKQTLEIAEMDFYIKDSLISGSIIRANADSDGIANAFDKNLLSFYSSKGIDNEQSTWIGIDFGEKKKVTKLKFAPRSDVNYIKPGDTYELFYWNDKWKSLGEKMSKSYSIEYSDVPKNAVLWLRNLSEGVEEELFVYKEGRQYFWNSTEY